MYNKDQKGVIFETIVGSSKDGPGLRYVIYFKGCNFSCPWCSNPEGLNKNELLELTGLSEKDYNSKLRKIRRRINNYKGGQKNEK